MIIISFCNVIINIRLVYLFSLLVFVFEDDDGSDRVASRFGILICKYYGCSIQDQGFLIWLLLHIFMVDIVGCFLLLACVVFVFLGVALCLRTCCCFLVALLGLGSPRGCFTKCSTGFICWRFAFSLL